jgi:L-fuculose-phosphate aldolase
MTDRLPVPYFDRNLAIAQPGGSRDEESLRGLIGHIGRLMYEARFIAGTSGSISARLDANSILITPPALSKGFLHPEQVIRVGLGEARDPATGDIGLDSELLMHLACYRQRADVYGVIHAHPPTATALTIAEVSMRTCVVPEAIITLGLVPTAAYSIPTSPESQEAIRLLIAQHDAILLAYHGSLTVGPDLWRAYLALETLEHTAIILHRTAQLGPITPLPPEQVARLLELRRQLGYWRPGDDERFCAMCGVC